MSVVIRAIISFIFIGNILLAHHQLAYLSPFENGVVAFISSGHRLPVGDKFSGLQRYENVSVVVPSGKKMAVKSVESMGAFGFSVLPCKESGLYILGAYAEHYGTKTTKGYFVGTKKEAIKAGWDVVGTKHTYRYSKSYRWKNSGPSPALRLGHKIEIVPESLAQLVKKGDKISITLYFKGKPAANRIIGISSMSKNGELGHPDEKEKFLTTVKTDNNGVAVIEMSESGWIILTAEETRKNPEPDVDMLYISTTTSFWVTE